MTTTDSFHKNHRPRGIVTIDPMPIGKSKAMPHAAPPDDTLITLAEAVEHFPRRHGRPVHTKTIKRRITHGCRGVRLHAIKSGGVWYTTMDWIRQFNEACTRQAMPAGERTEPQRKLADRRAAELLERKYGFRPRDDGRADGLGQKGKRRRPLCGRVGSVDCRPIAKGSPVASEDEWNPVTGTTGELGGIVPR